MSKTQGPATGVAEYFGVLAVPQSTSSLAQVSNALFALDFESVPADDVISNWIRLPLGELPFSAPTHLFFFTGAFKDTPKTQEKVCRKVDLLLDGCDSVLAVEIFPMGNPYGFYSRDLDRSRSSEYFFGPYVKPTIGTFSL